ncbi:hypothetical protein CVT27_00245 [Streptomyces cavourensis]|nr:hypothetical protein CVT27_00245 [Streptomyces cavourensis]
MRSHAPDTAAPALGADDATFDTRPSGTRAHTVADRAHVPLEIKPVSWFDIPMTLLARSGGECPASSAPGPGPLPIRFSPRRRLR